VAGQSTEMAGSMVAVRAAPRNGRSFPSATQLETHRLASLNHANLLSWFLMPVIATLFDSSSYTPVVRFPSAGLDESYFVLIEM
jgi:hypothetical protein